MTSPNTLQDGNLLRLVRARFQDKFHDNAALATLVFVAAAMRSHAVAVVGPSGAGKSYTTEEVLNCLPDEDVLRVSHLTGPGLFALKNAAVIFSDELVRQEMVLAISRMLISTGKAKANLSKSNGEPRQMEIEGPIALINCHVDDPRDFQDSSRAVVVRISESNAQARLHTLRAASENTPDGRRDLDAWKVFQNQVKGFLRKVRPPAVSDFVLDADLVSQIPATVEPHTTRRLKQLIHLAFGITWLENIYTETCPIRCGPEHLLEAAELLINARAVDDHQPLSERARQFLVAFIELVAAHGITIDGQTRTITINMMLTRLNTPHYRMLATSLINENKRHGKTPNAKGLWTRAIVTPLLDELRDANLIDYQWRSSQQHWNVTEDGQQVINLGPRNSYHLIRNWIRNA